MHTGIALAFLLCLPACNAPGSSSEGQGPGSSAPSGSTTPGNGAPSGTNGGSQTGITQADADRLCAELNKGGNTASCVLRDGQVVIQPK